MGLCCSTGTSPQSHKPSTAVGDEDVSVTEMADKENEDIRHKDHVKRASMAASPSSRPDGRPRPAHVQGALDQSARTSSMASRTMQKMIHTQSSADLSVDDLYTMGNGKVLGTGVTGDVRVVVQKSTGKKYAHKLLRVSRVRSARKVSFFSFMVCISSQYNVLNAVVPVD